MRIFIVFVVAVFVCLSICAPSLATEDSSSVPLYSANEGIYNPEFTRKYSRIADAHSSCLNNIVVQYYLVNGEWPESWDDLIEDYMPFLPISIWRPYENMKLLLGTELSKRTRSDTVFALVEEDGSWLIMVPRMRLDCEGFEWAYDIDIVRSTRDQTIEMFKDKPEYYSNNMEKFGMLFSSFAQTQMRASYEALGRMPENHSEFLIGWEINRNYNYLWNPFLKIGIFKIDVYPEENAYHAVFNGWRDGHRYGIGIGFRFTDGPFPEFWSPTGGLITKIKHVGGKEDITKEPERNPNELERYTLISQIWFTNWVPAVTGKKP